MDVKGQTRTIDSSLPKNPFQISDKENEQILNNIKMPSPDSFNKFIKKGYQDHIIDFLSSSVSPNSEEFYHFQRKYVQSLPSCLVDESMNDLLLNLSQQNKINLILKTIPLMLSERTKNLCLYPLDYSVYLNVANPNLINQVTGILKKIEKPNLTNLQINIQGLHFLCWGELLKCIPSLKSLTIKSFNISSVTMQRILNFCPGIVELEWLVQDSSEIFFDIDNWPKHESLRVFRIFGPFFNIFTIDPIKMNKILYKLPNLEMFQIDEIFLNVFFSNPCDYSSYFTLETLPEYDENFLNINTICVNGYENEVVDFVSKCLHLEHLSISNCNNDQMIDMLEICGSKLRTLELKMDFVNLSSVLRLCPNLEYLDQYDVGDIEADEVVPHSNLRYYRSCIAADDIITFLKGVTSLEIVQIDKWRTYSTNDLEIIISAFKKIKILHIYYECDFSQNFLEKIITRCQCLEELVMDNNNIYFNLEDVDMFVRNNNFNLKIINSEAFNITNNFGLKKVCCIPTFN